VRRRGDARPRARPRRGGDAPARQRAQHREHHDAGLPRPEGRVRAGPGRRDRHRRPVRCAGHGRRDRRHRARGRQQRRARSRAGLPAPLGPAVPGRRPGRVLQGRAAPHRDPGL
ncbi:MAG: hypothetical protein AVDCRST_MAG48-395, partial [uncultured Friedmanniella sp.]